MSHKHRPYNAAYHIGDSQRPMNTTGALQFLITTLISIYCYIILARFLLQLVKADFYNPISQAVVKATNPLLIPLRKIIPGFAGLDWAALILLYGFQVLKVAIIFMLQGGGFPVAAILIYGLLQTASLFVWFYIFIIFIQIILSWVAPQQYNPMIILLNQISEPILAPARKIVPPMGGLDLSPTIVLLILYTLTIWLGL